jgi:hypothetical protein
LIITGNDTGNGAGNLFGRPFFSALFLVQNRFSYRVSSSRFLLACPAGRAIRFYLFAFLFFFFCQLTTEGKKG